MEKVYGPEYNEYEREAHVHMLMHALFLVFFFYKTERMILIKTQNQDFSLPFIEITLICLSTLRFFFTQAKKRTVKC